MSALRALARLTRFDSCLLVFSAVFVPTLTRTKDLKVSFERAIPLLFIAMCTYIANDLDDIERDRINHPTRPLPSGEFTPTRAAVLYFVCMGLALLATRHYIITSVAFLYYLLLALSISYGYVVELLPFLKAPYVAGAITIPVLIVVGYYPGQSRLLFAAISTLLINLGRELCKDLVDRPGDIRSFMHLMKPLRVSALAFGLQAIGLLIFVPILTHAVDFVVLVSMAVVLVGSGVLWFKLAARQKSIVAMKIQLALGLYFLF